MQSPLNPDIRLVLDIRKDWFEVYDIDFNDDYVGDIDEIFESPKECIDFIKNYFRKLILEGKII